MMEQNRELKVATDKIQLYRCALTHPLQAKMDTVMGQALDNIEKSQSEDMAQMMMHLKQLHVNQSKFEEEMRHLIIDLKGDVAANARQTAQEMVRLAAEDAEECSPQKSVKKMKSHLRTLTSITSSEVVIPFEKLIFTPNKPPLGKGAFGVVMEATHYGTLVAVKRSVVDENLSTEAYREVMREAKMWNTLKHPNIVLLMGIVATPLCIVLEKMHSCIHGMLHRDGRSFAPFEVIHVIDSVSQALTFLHAHSIIHRDIKPQNILVNDSLHVVKVTDFGLSVVREESMSISGVAGTPMYMAPEIWEEDTYGPAADVYSLSLTMWEMFSEKVPFKGVSITRLAREVVDKQKRPSIPESCPELFAELIQQAWVHEPHRRPLLEEIRKRLEHIKGQLEQEQVKTAEDKDETRRRSIGMFKEIDTNHDGFVDPDELLMGLIQEPYFMEPDEVSQLFKVMDTNADGLLQLEEFCDGQEKLRQAMQLSKDEQALLGRRAKAKVKEDLLKEADKAEEARAAEEKRAGATAEEWHKLRVEGGGTLKGSSYTESQCLANYKQEYQAYTQALVGRPVHIASYFYGLGESQPYSAGDRTCVIAIHDRITQFGKVATDSPNDQVTGNGVHRGKFVNDDSLPFSGSNAPRVLATRYASIRVRVRVGSDYKQAVVIESIAMASNRDEHAKVVKDFFEAGNEAIVFTDANLATLYASGRTTGMTVSIDHGTTSISSYWEGYSIQNARKGAAAFFNFGVSDFSNDGCYVLPDGQEMHLKRTSDAMNVYLDTMQFSELPGGVGTDLAGNIILAGPGTMASGFPEAFQKGITPAMQSRGQKRHKVIAPPAPERLISAWIGGSILGSLHSTTVLTKAQYDEAGVHALVGRHHQTLVGCWSSEHHGTKGWPEPASDFRLSEQFWGNNHLHVP